MGAMDAIVLGPGEGECHAVGSSSVAIKVGDSETAGTFYCGEVELQEGFAGPPPHVHERLHDMFYVLEGTLTMRLGDDSCAVAAGTFVCVPPGVTHTFSNPGPGAVRFLNFNTPAGWESYMRDLGAAAAEGRELSASEIGAIAARYDFRPVQS
jgi:mannose-6-phosphate isomerase-like protein (cupin superfamily)